MDSLNAFLRPNMDRFFDTTQEILENARKELHSAVSRDVRMLGIVFMPPNPVEEDEAQSYNISFCDCDDDQKVVIEAAADIMCEVARRLGESREEQWGIIQAIANRAHEISTLSVDDSER